MANTPSNGSDTFPTTENEFYTLIETLAVQEIDNIKSSNRLEDAVYYYDLTEDNGTVIEQALIDKAKSRAVDKTQCNKAPVDPTLAARYFNNWTELQYPATVRRDEIRKIIANKGVGVENVVESIVDTTTQGRDADDFENARKLILETTVTDYSTILNGTPTNMRGVIYALRDMYDALRTENTLFTVTGWKMGVPEKDIRIGVSSKLLNLLDVTELANIFNLTKVELLGKLVVIPVSDLDKSKWYKVVVYDRHAFNHGRRVSYMDNEKCANAGYWNYYLFDTSAWFYSPLYKATSIDCTAAATAALAEIITPPSEP